MFHVTVYENKKKEYVGFQTEGHAGYAEAGQDIVCAAASDLPWQRRFFLRQWFLDFLRWHMMKTMHNILI